MNRQLLPFLLVFAFCLVLCREYWFQWESSYDSWGWIFFLIWLVPLGFFRWEGCVSVAIAGLTLCTLGSMGSLRIVQYAGLALSGMGLTAWSRGHYLWLIASLSWMPALGWISTQIVPGQVVWFRLAFAILMIPALRKKVWA